MKVYRICRLGEINHLINDKNYSQVGVDGKILIEKQQNDNINSHVYDFRKTYLHFFKDLPSIFYCYTEDKYLCTYEIPDELLEKTKSEGYYLDYINRNRLQAVTQYAIDINELSFDYLQKIEKINEYIDFDDYLMDKSLEDYLEPVYLNKRPFIKGRRIS